MIDAAASRRPLGAPRIARAARGRAPDVVVIGAGLAGLSAARRLQAHGAAVVALEARDRPGGRILSQRLASGHAIDLGAQFMGDGQSHVAALADEAGLRRVPAPATGDVLHLPAEDGEPRRAPAGAPPLPILDRLDAWQALRRLERSAASLAADDVARLDRIDAGAFIRGRTFGEAAFRAIGGYLEGELCTSLAHVSAYETLQQAASVGGLAGESASARWFLADGADGMTRFLADALGPSLVLGAPVSRVAQDAGGVAVTAATGDYLAERAVVAVPPQLYGAAGVLAGLPPSRRDALAGWRCGAAVKTILAFREPWWRRSGLSGAIHCPGGAFGAAVDASPGDGPGVLVIFSTARGAQSLARLPDENARIAAALRWLSRAHGADAPEPVAARSVDWSADPLSLGGYASRRGVGGWSAAPDLFAPHGRLHFAGTETADRWRSFMDGALQSGLRAAAEVLAARRDGSPSR